MDAGRQAVGMAPGTVLEGRYRLGVLIAKGGMSAVYRGMDLRLDRPVAIKIMKSEYADDPQFLARFEREARAAAGLHHSGIVAVYDQGRDGDTVFLVMELVDGGTLRDLLKEQGAMSVPVALSILEPVLSALGAAHEAGLVHRDVKPENVLISSRGEVKVADFGLVRAVTSTTMATGDVILGTVAYLSPEQVSTGYSDARSDVYSAGILAFEMLTGAPPYAGESAISVAYQHVHSEVPAPSSLAIGVPDPIDDILLRATARNATDRPADAGAFLAELVRIRARLLIRRVPVPVPTPAAPLHQTRVLVDNSEHPTTVEDQGLSGSRVSGTDTAPVPSGPPVGRGRKRRRRVWAVVIIVVLLAAAAAVTGWWLGSGRWTAVPPLVGVSRDSAVQTVQSAGLVAVVTEAHSNGTPAGRVASVIPEEGNRQLRGSEVTLVVSTGRPTVPAVKPGSTPADAVQVLKAADLTAVIADGAAVYDTNIPAGMVVGTDPAAGAALDIGTKVTVIVSKGKKPVAIPTVADKTVDDATNALTVAGLQLGPQVAQFDSTRKAGTVIGTKPGAGATVDSGATVQLVVSNALEVPKVAGATQTEAEAALAAAGLKATVGGTTFDPNVDGGRVIAGDPGPGTLLDPAQNTVTLTMSNAITMPNLVGKDVDKSANQLTGLGLKVRVTQLFGLGSTVQSQSPAPGTRVAPGATVSLNALI